MSLSLSGELTRRRLTEGLTDNTSTARGVPEGTAVCESTLIRIRAPRWPKWSWQTRAISTRPITPAAKAQVSWAARLPAERVAVMLRSASTMEACQSKIVDCLIRDSGSTRVKAELEWQFVHAVTLEAASF